MSNISSPQELAEELRNADLFEGKSVSEVAGEDNTVFSAEYVRNLQDELTKALQEQKQLRTENSYLAEDLQVTELALNEVTNDWLDYVEAEERANSKKNLTAARIRVYLSRQLTWAEKEFIETNHDDPHSRRIEATPGMELKFHVAPNRQHVWVEGYLGSRVLYDLVSAALDQHFVNVFPQAVRTFREYNGE